MYDHLAKLAEKIGNDLHDTARDPQEDSSDIAGEKIAEAIRGVDLQWTTEVPKEPGWYWAKPVIFWRFANMQPSIVFVSYSAKNELWVSDDKVNDVSLDSFSHWLGPLPVPDQPKEEA